MEPSDDDTTSESIDLTLRHVTRQFPEQLARALLPPGTTITSATWMDTQLTSRQRRLDRALDVIADGERRLEHTEWQTRMDADMPFRLFEYHNLLAIALAAEAPPGQKPPRIESTLVLLSGRDKPWPSHGAYRTSRRGSRFCGVHYRIEPVYQHTIAELAERGPLWLIFAPLARDADPEQMEIVLDKLKAESPPRAFEELAVALSVMAAADRRRRGLDEVVASLLGEEVVMESWIYKQGKEKGIEEGIERGIERGIEKGIERGIERGIEKGIERGTLPAQRALVMLYEARFGAMSDDLRARLDATRDPEVLTRWCDVIARAAREEVDRRLAGG